ncbi:MAG: class I SAM-dependent methyltransferase [Raineya sp.]|jgi:2-polyprenyl-3-methyl-5-hydroxy-6-metoxy-1,4-benzoquinol methylase|nr:class I SAM-dependent methyltransferase [Raineya sp.]
MFSTTEITSHEIASDNPIHQRLFFAYYQASQMIKGDILEIGCGVGRGLAVILEKSGTYTAVDKNEKLIDKLQIEYPNHRFITHHIPPLESLEDNTFDYVITFQVIEHIENDDLFVKEIQRVLKPHGKAFISTPNIKQSLTRNPWHIREYTADGLEQLMKKYFSKVEKYGVDGNEKVMQYHEENRKSVAKFKRLDIFNLEKHLPRWALQIPYDFLNRFNRKKLMQNENSLSSQISYTDYFLSNNPDKALDLFYIAEK